MRFVTIIAASMALALTVSVKTRAEPIWQVEGERNYYFIGTIHMLRDSDYPLPESFANTLAQCDTLWLETDIQALEDPAFVNQMVQIMMAPAGQTLADQLPEETYQRLAYWSGQVGLPIEALAGFEPWAATIIVATTAIEQAGFNPDLSVDEYLYDLAVEAGIDVRFLETGLEQIKMMAEAGQSDSLAMVEQSLDDLEQLDEMMEQMMAAWRSGNMEALWITTSVSEYPSVEAILLNQRNDNWVAQLTAADLPEGTQCVAAGSLHFAGERSLVNQFEALGYRIQQKAN